MSYRHPANWSTMDMPAKKEPAPEDVQATVKQLLATHNNDYDKVIDLVKNTLAEQQVKALLFDTTSAEGSALTAATKKAEQIITCVQDIQNTAVQERLSHGEHLGVAGRFR